MTARALTQGVLSMKILLVGSGGREHVLLWAMKRSSHAPDVFICPGNAGMEELGTLEAIEPVDIPALKAKALSERVDLVVVGPEGPLPLGIVDEMEDAGLKVFGPRRGAAQLETSKAFSKQFMRRHGVPTADFEVFDDADRACRFIDDAAWMPVIKADGLAQGKGSIVPASKEQAKKAVESIMVDRRFGAAGDMVVVEERLHGEELSILVVSDGSRWLTLPPSQDHKAIFEGDKGPNTGGMGAYSPVGFVDEQLIQDIENRFVTPTLQGMAEEGNPYRGVLYIGLIQTSEGLAVIEFNCRFGDPEAQVVLPCLEMDFTELFLSAAEGNLVTTGYAKAMRHAVCVVLASGGYPGEYEKGKPIRGIEDAIESDSVFIFHAGTKGTVDGFETAGGRVLGVTGVGGTFAEARRTSYEAVGKINFDNMYYRKDIGHRELSRHRELKT
jgi:phosphoribosylamine--glycine ligase